MECIYTIDPLVDQPIMLLDRHLGNLEDGGQGIDGAMFARELLYLDTLGKSAIQIWINSEGGKVVDAYSIISAMLKSKTKVDTYCIGIAASAAACVFVSGRKRIMADYGFLMFHNPFIETADGKMSKTEMEMTNTFTKSLVTLTSERTGKSYDDTAAMMGKETWLNADAALAQGYCDEVEVSSEQNKKRMYAAQGVQARVKTGAECLRAVVNQLSKQNNYKMKAVTAKLNLNEAADETSIVTAITEIQNRSKDFESRATTAENSLKDVQAKLTASEAKLKEVQDKHDALVKECEDAEKAVAQEDAAKLVADAVTAGKIEDDKDVIDYYTKAAVVDFKATKAVLDKMKTNKKAPVINSTTTKTEGGEQVPSYTAAGVMARIRMRNEKK